VIRNGRRYCDVCENEMIYRRATDPEHICLGCDAEKRAAAVGHQLNGYPITRLYADGGHTLVHEGRQITVSRSGFISWMEDWVTLNGLVQAGVVRQKWYPNSMHHTDYWFITAEPALGT
jgi:hypothetical protein